MSHIYETIVFLSLRSFWNNWFFPSLLHLKRIVLNLLSIFCCRLVYCSMYYSS